MTDSSACLLGRDAGARRFSFFNDTATTEIYTLSLHDALPISHHIPRSPPGTAPAPRPAHGGRGPAAGSRGRPSRCPRSEEHTSELQSRQYLVCRLLLEKKQSSSSLRITRPPTLPPLSPPSAPP